MESITLAPSMTGIIWVESVTIPDKVTVDILCTNWISRLVVLNVGYSRTISDVATEIDGVSVVVILQVALVDNETKGSKSNSYTPVLAVLLTVIEIGLSLISFASQFKVKVMISVTGVEPINNLPLIIEWTASGYSIAGNTTNYPFFRGPL